MDEESENYTPKEKRINFNLVGLAIVVVAFVASLVDVLRPDVEEGEQVVDERRIVHILHWQLEPGFREALDAVIKDYNNLPHVREAGYRVQQMAVTERVYTQFLNVHLISGTAPDLVALGQQATMEKNRAQFFEPYLEVLEKPNPYNSEAYLPEDMDPELRAFLKNAPWKQTFMDGLESGLDPSLGYYYTIPVASWGTLRIYYNKSLLAAVKSLLREHFGREQRPEWLETVLDPDPNATPGAFLPDSPALREWLATDEPPETFGQLVLLCEACREYAREIGNDKLVPIAGSNYSKDLFVDMYNAPFFYAWEDRLDYNRDSSLSYLDVFAGYEMGDWDFQEPRLKAFYDLQMKLASYFPVGFLGLDREQANRRFILGNGLFLATGAWDAPGIFIGASNRLEEEDRFEVGIINFPLPGEGEQWGQFDPLPRSEAAGVAGVPMALYKFSENREEAVDFLHYLTSYAGNGKFIRLAGWLPTVVGIDVVERMEPFLPVVRGVRGTLSLSFNSGNVRTIYNGQYYLLISGELEYDTFVENVTAALEDERNGIDRQWYEHFRRNRETVRGIERSLSLQRFNQLTGDGLDSETDRYRRVLFRSSKDISGLSVPHQWYYYGFERPFPEF